MPMPSSLSVLCRMAVACGRTPARNENRSAEEGKTAAEPLSQTAKPANRGKARDTGLVVPLLSRCNKNCVALSSYFFVVATVFFSFPFFPHFPFFPFPLFSPLLLVPLPFPLVYGKWNSGGASIVFTSQLFTQTRPNRIRSIRIQEPKCSVVSFFLSPFRFLSFTLSP